MMKTILFGMIVCLFLSTAAGCDLKVGTHDCDWRAYVENLLGLDDGADVVVDLS